MTSVAFVIGYGSDAEKAADRAVALLQPASIVTRVPSSDELGGALAEIAADLPGQTVLFVLHIADIGDTVQQDRLQVAVDAAKAAVDAFPAAHIRQFVIALVGRNWDDDEVRTLLSLDGGVDSAFVISRSNEAAVQLHLSEEQAMAADLAVALVNSALANRLGQERFWLVGAGAIYYRKSAILAALAAYHSGGFLRNSLLSPLPANHTECDEAKAWVADQCLGREEHRRILERSSMGGSLLADTHLDRRLFHEVTPELLLDALRSFTVQNSDRLVSTAAEQIARNRAEDLDKRVADLESRTSDVLVRSLRIASAQRFVECVRDGLRSALQDVQVALSAHDDQNTADQLEQDAIEEALGRAIRQLPYPAAITGRAVGFGAVGVLACVLLSTLVGFSPSFAVLGLLVGAFSGLLMAAQYHGRLARISGLRERYLTLADRRAQAAVDVELLKAASQEIQELQMWAVGGTNSISGRLAALKQTVAGLADRYDQIVVDRVVGSMTTTRYSVLLPSVQDLSTDELASRFPLPPSFDLPARLAKCVLNDGRVGVVAIDQLDAGLVEAFSSALEDTVWGSLALLLQDSTSSLTTATKVLGIRTGPIVRPGELAVSTAEYRRMAVLATGAGQGLDDLLTQVGVEGRLASDDTDTVVQISLLPVPGAMRG